MVGMAQESPSGGPAFTEGRVETDGFSIRYVAAGQGSAVVMLRGGGGLALSKLHSELAKKYRVIAFEMPGFGQSPPNVTSQSVRDLAETMAAATAKLGVDKYALVGMSFGSRVALWQALQRHQQVDLLVLIAPTAVLPEGYTVPHVASDQIGRLMFAHPENAPAQQRADPAEVAKEMALLERIKGNRRDPDLEKRLGEVQALTLVVFGTTDQVVPPAMGRIYRERIPNCHYVLVYDAGHAAPDERPEAVANSITDFLDMREAFIVGRRDSRINP